MPRPIIRLGDTTDHNGTVIESFAHFDINGINASGVGHMVSCPRCLGGPFPIVGPGVGATVNGIEIAVEGMKTSCGASLIPSQIAVSIN